MWECKLRRPRRRRNRHRRHRRHRRLMYPRVSVCSRDVVSAPRRVPQIGTWTLRNTFFSCDICCQIVRAGSDCGREPHSAVVPTDRRAPFLLRRLAPRHPMRHGSTRRRRTLRLPCCIRTHPRNTLPLHTLNLLPLLTLTLIYITLALLALHRLTPRHVPLLCLKLRCVTLQRSKETNYVLKSSAIAYRLF